MITSLRLQGIMAIAMLMSVGSSSFSQLAHGQSSNPLPTTTASGQTQETAARQALLEARRALVGGNVEQASSWLDKAETYLVDFSTMPDSPAAIRPMLQRQNELVRLMEQKDASFNSQAAAFLLLQAEGLIDHNDLESAELLIRQAEAFKVEFNPAIGTPAQMMEKLQAARTKLQQQATATGQEFSRLMAQAQLAIDQDRWQEANGLIQQAKALQVDESQFGSDELRPWQLELKIQNALNRQNSAVQQSSFDGGNRGSNRPDQVVQAGYDPAKDTTRVVQVASMEELDQTDVASNINRLPRSGMEYYNAGLQALAANDRDSAIELFQLAWKNRSDLDGSVRKAIKDQIERLAPDSEVLKASLASQETEIMQPRSLDDQREGFRQLQSEIFRERAAAEGLLQSRPRQALEKMYELRSQVARSGLDAENQRPLLAAIDRDISQMQQYIQQNLPEIMNDEANAEAKDKIERIQQERWDVETQLQKLVEDYNKLIGEKRFAEAGVIVKQAAELAPDSVLVSVLIEKHRAQSMLERALATKALKEQRFLDGLHAAEQASVGMDFDKPLEFPTDLTAYIKTGQKRLEQLEMSRYDSPEEARIYNLLKTQKIQGEFRGTLADAMESLADQVGINIIFDDLALAAENVNPDRMINVPIKSPISLKSAMEVILSQVGLVYVVENEIIRVTSKDARSTNLATKTYYIGDLVLPMAQHPDPMRLNFMQPGMPNPNQPNQGSFNMGPDNLLANLRNDPNSPFYGMGGYGGGPQRGVPTYSQFGGDKYGGITEFDFIQLINLIQDVIPGGLWEEDDGGAIRAFAPNLSLIVTQTQEVHDQIQDLLRRLRELNDVQIVIEVRFITMTDDFFERIGVDFDFSINDNSGLTPEQAVADTRPGRGTTVIGRSQDDGQNFIPTDNLDLKFLQGSFSAAQPLFGANAFSPSTAGSFGFAILSDIEVFFLISAAKGDTRTSITQAPTVTMFNGQPGTIFDGAQRPFVTSVVPIVGDFAVAQQPIITLVPEGRMLNVRAVVSDDRRFVRVQLTPSFTEVTEEREFTFDGSTTTRRTSDSILDDLLRRVQPGRTPTDEDFEVVTTGITIQQPVVTQTNISTVVSVPDGGTVLLGGIKRMQEGRVESGLPMLSSIPYVNRLFRNTAIGHRTQNLMMMVTPRIIIQKELEEDQVGLIE